MPTSSDGLVSCVLAPLLGDLLRPHPELVVELRADTRSLDLSRREADVAVRLGRPTEAALVAKKLGPVRFGLYAAADYLARNGTVVRKFFLHVSREEQKKRFLERIEEPDKNWKFSAGDVRERAHWDAYMAAYQKGARARAVRAAPPIASGGWASPRR